MQIQGLPARDFLRELYRCIGEDNVFNGAAALAFYLTLAIFPALIALMSVIPYLPIEDVDQAIMDLIGQALPDQSATLVDGIVEEVTQEQRGPLLSLGLLATLWAASTGMYAVMQQLNISYDVEEARSFVRARATAIVLSLLFGGLVLGAFSLVVLGGVIEEWMGELLRLLRRAGRRLRGLPVDRHLPLVADRPCPDLPLCAQRAQAAPLHHARQHLWNRGPDPRVTGFSFYVSNFADYSATYGSIGAVIVLMLWLYIAGLVILVGSEINALLEHLSPHGKRKGEQTPQEGRAEGPP